MKILYIVSTLSRTGPTRQLLNLVSSIKNKAEVSILTLSPEPNDSMIDHFLKLNVNIKSLKLGRVAGVFWSKKLVSKHIAELSPDVVHTQGLRADSLVSGMRSFKPLHVSSIRNIPWHDYPAKFGFFIGRAMSYQHCAAIRKTKVPVACSESVFAATSFLNSSIKIIQNGVDTKFFTCSADKDEGIRLKNELGLLQEKVVFISVGSLIQRKRPLEIIYSFLNSDHKNNSYLLFVGNGPMLQQMKDVAQNCSNILFLGQRSDIVKILRISDCFISAADSEGLPNTVLEAMSTDLVPILSDIPPHREILAKLNDNQTFTFPVGDVAILSERLNQFAYSKSVFSKGFIREYIDQNFSAVKTSSSYLDLYGKAEGI